MAENLAGKLGSQNSNLVLIGSTVGTSVIEIPENYNEIVVLAKAGAEYASATIVKGLYYDYVLNGLIYNSGWWGFTYTINYSQSGIYLKMARNTNTNTDVASGTEIRVYGK